MVGSMPFRGSLSVTHLADSRSVWPSSVLARNHELVHGFRLVTDAAGSETFTRKPGFTGLRSQIVLAFRDSPDQLRIASRHFGHGRLVRLSNQFEVGKPTFFKLDIGLFYGGIAPTLINNTPWLPSCTLSDQTHRFPGDCVPHADRPK